MSIDHKYTNNIICPYCGYEDFNSWEVESGDEDLGLLECSNCEKSFYAQRHIIIEYSTEKPTYGTCKHCGKENVVIEDYYSNIGKYENLCVECGYKEKRRLNMEYFDMLNRSENNGTKNNR